MARRVNDCSARALMPRFVNFIQPQKPDRGAAQRFFECLRRRADDIDLIRFTYVGSAVKGTGLRRYRTRDSVVPGQDVDIALTVGDLPVAKIASTHASLQAHARACIEEDSSLRPDDFSLDRLSLKLAPVLDITGLGQFYIGQDRTLEPVQLSLQTQEIKKRTTQSQTQNPRVPFNDLIRVLKWWRHIRPPDGCPPPSSYRVEAMAARAYDARGVGQDWFETLADWCDWLSLQELEPALSSWLAGGAATFTRAARLVQDDDCDALVELLERDALGSALRAKWTA